ncbi:thiamine/thiamine pyrophosphate ABC transporter permease [Dongia rigui]|uniref:Thiamine transport system permease protein ThiP n=1 Tax=Dongia rigui TaxID=940149 RepID=A0ABU5DVB3_9PROT|nr:thiamine/thiamine pyrophosphate ABC transporter permease [Dongia rigui]MDY0871225.1 thiamine/thiamine pyrophosphate ABC transporter permease [Dongia rigui]
MSQRTTANGRQPAAFLIGCGLALALAAAAIAVLVLLWQAGGDIASVSFRYLGKVLAFTLWQALLSTVLSLVAAVPVTRALARRSEFPGRAWLLRLCALPMVMPTIVGIFGVVAVFGGSGYLAAVAALAGSDWRPRLYGLQGILIAHVFFNLPLAIRLLLPAYAAVPAESWRLAAQLGMTGRDVFRFIEMPLLRQQLPGIAVIIFMLCFTTFAVALTLGGGPAATTLEVAIYQALRFDFDLSLGALLAILQVVLCAGGAFAVWRMGREMTMGAATRLVIRRYDGATTGTQLMDYGFILLAALFLVLPIAALVQKGIAGISAAASPASLSRAGIVSLALGLGGGGLATVIGYLLAQTRQRLVALGHPRAAMLMALTGRLGLFVSPMVIGTGIFLAATGHVDLYALAVPGVIVLNAVMALPFVLGLLEPAIAMAAERHDRLCAALGIKGWHRWREIDWPVLRRPLGSAFAFASVIAMGDLGAIALFGSQDLTNLTLLLYGQLGAYRLDGAASTALLLLALTLVTYAALERWVGGRELR